MAALCVTAMTVRMVVPNRTGVAEAARILRAGGLVAFPTETVYGLGADATSDTAVARIFAAKDRPRFNPLIVHLLDFDAAARYVVPDDRARALAKAFWPGPLTLVLPRRSGCALSLLVSAGLDTAAVRAPSADVARRLIAAASCPIAAPSANPAGAVSPTTAAHVAASLGDRVDMILDGGPCAIGLESTVIDLSGPVAVLLRPGGLPEEAIERVVGPLAAPEAGCGPRSPGMLRSHYAPVLPLRLDATDAQPDEALLAFGPDVPPGAAETLNLSPAGDVVEAAANLFAMMRRLDRPEYARIAVVPVPETGLGRAINDRLRRAAAPRG